MLSRKNTISVFAATLVLSLSASATVFEFKDEEGFVECLNSKNIALTSKGQEQDVKKYMDSGEIQKKCLTQAETLASKNSKDKDMLKSFVTAITQNSAHENALGIIDILVKAHPSECNDDDNYAVMMKALGHPDNFPSPRNSYFSKVSKILKLCMKDKEFSTDFMEEKTSSDSYVKKNVETFLKKNK